MSTTVSPDFAHEADRFVLPPSIAAVRPLHRQLEASVARRARERGWLTRRALVASEALAFVLAFAFSGTVASDPAYVLHPAFWMELPLVVALLPLWIVCAKVAGLYDRDARFASYSTTDDISPVFGIATLGTLLALFAWNGLAGRPDYGRVAASWLSVALLVILGRAAARALVQRSSRFRQNAVIVGSGPVGQALAQKFGRHPEAGIDVIGFVDERVDDVVLDPDGPALLGRVEDLTGHIAALNVQRVLIAFPAVPYEQVLDLTRELRELGVQVDIVPRLVDVIGPGTDIHDVEGMPLIGLATLNLSRSSLIVKRAVDVTIAGLALALLSPLMLLIALAIVVDSRGPAFFVQTRVGLHHRPFRLLKFRTMVRDADTRKDEFAHLNRHLSEGGDPRMFKICNDPRVTRVGRILRRYFLDELPQLINVVRGEMSLIGPRPLIPEEARFVEDWGVRRLDLKPGMTGSWQVLGRSTIAFEEMVKLDYLYVTTWSLGHDLRLLLRTLPLVLSGEAPV